jgi:hypothetical protein
MALRWRCENKTTLLYKNKPYKEVEPVKAAHV